MSITKSAFAQYVRGFQLRELFNDMGWNNDRTKQPIIVNEKTYLINGIAEKSGFRIFTCMPADGVAPPDRETRKKIERNITKLFQEHLIIYFDSSKSLQIWQLAVRKAGLPTKVSETTYLLTQDPELLYQRTSGLLFTLDEEEKITIVDVTKRVSDNFQQNNEKVTKKFYESFKKEHGAFLKFIDGIADKAKLDWYASLMLNRLMFCYFIQKQRFLDDNMDYLQEKLKECSEKKGKNKFYSFYRDFLLALFHKGLGAPEHSKEIQVELGRIPYLNGGLFDEHEIEKEFDNIQIDDKAFKRLFDFFDEWNWHLDTREAATGKDINPDVIGYIFEKYINDRAQMGAYYTKEDITDYISKNCVIPWLFDETKRNYPAAFSTDGWLWSSVKNSGTEYIYDAVKYGVPDVGAGSKPAHDSIFKDLPEEIQKGFDPELENKVVDGKSPWLWELRKDWNKPAPSTIALPTEIYREVIERRKRYADIKDKIENGEIREINDFITYNLNIRQFAQNVIEDTVDPDFIRHFYKALSSVTILDPTCGSGAFLFAALNILEPLYETCIRRMQAFVQEGGKGKYKFFEDTLRLVNAPEHPNLQYFIYKSIILNNLYGVDIMNESVEIAKLRLFLKLVATVEADYRKENLGLEPLPDVDFNIRAGNTLVGYATKKQIDEIAGMFVTEAHKKEILLQCDMVARAFERFKGIQLKGADDYKEFKKAKDELNSRLIKLTDDLDKVCFIDQYKGDEKILHPDQIKPKDKAAIIAEYEKWLTAHRPFHWFAEFYEIVQGRKGFDVVIGNPPYVEYSSIRKSYELHEISFKNIECGNIFAMVFERSFSLLLSNGKIGLIVPISLGCTKRMQSLLEYIRSNTNMLCFSYFAERPSKLFSGAEVLLNIALLSVDKKSSSTKQLVTGLNKWPTDFRKYLFQSLYYNQIQSTPRDYLAPKITSIAEKAILQMVFDTNKKLSLFMARSSDAKIYYRIGGGRYWKIFTNFQPKFILNGNTSCSSRENYLFFNSIEQRDTAIAALSSSFFFWYFQFTTNGRDLNPFDLNEFPIDIDSLSRITDMSRCCKLLMEDYRRNKQLKEKESKKTGTIQYEEFYPRLSKEIIDQIDSLLAIHYGFTHAELDFIINYDIKYRMGKELEGGDEE